nr:glycogen debranching enzyme N-terminal domain-containing protein [Synechococcus elongatus]
MTITFGREICGDLAIAQQREWLVTNEIGGYASGTVAGLHSRLPRAFSSSPEATPRSHLASHTSR